MGTALMPADIHGGIAPVRAGATASEARLAAIMLHGRGVGARDMLDLADALRLADVAIFAPEAAGHSWWPASFLAPMATLEPYLLSALAAVDRAFDAASSEGFEDGRIVLVGFSQGGCLALEHTARRGRRVGHVFGLSAGLLGTADGAGPPVDDLYGHLPKRFDYRTTLAGLPVYLGCHAQDPHIPLRRVEESAAVLRDLGAEVRVEIAPGAGHGLSAADVATLEAVFSGSA